MLDNYGNIHIHVGPDCNWNVEILLMFAVPDAGSTMSIGSMSINVFANTSSADKEEVINSYPFASHYEVKRNIWKKKWQLQNKV